MACWGWSTWWPSLGDTVHSSAACTSGTRRRCWPPGARPSHRGPSLRPQTSRRCACWTLCSPLHLMPPVACRSRLPIRPAHIHTVAPCRQSTSYQYACGCTNCMNSRGAHDSDANAAAGGSALLRWRRQQAAAERMQLGFICGTINARLVLRNLCVETAEAGLQVAVALRPPRRWLLLYVLWQQRCILLLVPATKKFRFHTVHMHCI